jgi:hypothetical protein
MICLLFYYERKENIFIQVRNLKFVIHLFYPSVSPLLTLYINDPAFESRIIFYLPTYTIFTW